MVINNNYLNNINKISQNRTVPAGKKDPAIQGDFASILNSQVQKNSEIKFSKHAESRLQTRNIQLSAAQRQKIGEAVKKADEKGVKDSLVLMDNIAFVVNVKSRTVITAVNSSELKDNVFTNIDGAVFA